MANQEQLDILKQGVNVWNKWRKTNPDVMIDLFNAKLSCTNLSKFKLSHANLSHAFLSGADLDSANLSYALLGRATIDSAILSNADLSYASLRNAFLGGAYLRDTILSGADFSGVDLISTSFGHVDLRAVQGLEMVHHIGPSTIGIDTIYRSQGNIPEAFLEGAGVDDTFITYIRSLVGKPIEYYSCFISYSSKDEALARRLRADLQSHNVRCWFAPEDLKWGARTRPSIDEAIRFHDKLLLILSNYSVASGWVEHEVKTAQAKECKEDCTVLFPVCVDRAVFESPFDWATRIRQERNIGDFTRWKNHDDYQQAFSRLLRDLKSEAMTG